MKSPQGAQVVTHHLSTNVVIVEALKLVGRNPTSM